MPRVPHLTAGAAARRRAEWNALIVIAAAFSVGTAMSKSGAALAPARLAMDLVPAAWGATGALAAVYVLTWMLTEPMSRNEAAALVFPIAVALGASSGFLLPIGYQTHLTARSSGPAAAASRTSCGRGCPWG